LNTDTLLRYLSEECSEREETEVLHWLEADPVNRREFEELKQLWSASEEPSATDQKLFDVELDWFRLKDRIEKDSAGIERQDQFGVRRQSGTSAVNRARSAHQRFTPLYRVAAILVLASLAGFYLVMNFLTPPQEESAGLVMREVTTEFGQKSNIILSDGTYLIINSGSRLLLPENFKGSSREVHLLEREAYFEVVRDDHRPFRIHSGDTVVQVLGTSFSVRSYPEDEQTRVIVDNGKVLFGTGSEWIDGVQLTEKEMGIYRSETKELSKTEIDDKDLFLGWTQGYLKFHETPLKQVLQELERRYNVQLEANSEDIQNLLLTATLKGREFHNVLDVITTALDIRYYSDGSGKFVFLLNDREKSHHNQ